MGSRRVVRRVALVALVLAVLAVGGCSNSGTGLGRWSRLGLPPGASDRTNTILHLWIGAWIAALIIAALVWGLIVFAVIRYRRKSPDEMPRQLRYHMPLEALYTLAPFAIVAALFFHVITSNDEVLSEKQPAAHTVVVVGQQWQWTFNYRENPSSGAAVTIDSTNQGVYDPGTLSNPAELWLVRGQTVKFILESPDVIHSFWVPAFYFKRDVIPGRVSDFELTPTVDGVFEGKCAELCGLYHSRMLFSVHVVEAAQYRQHLQQLAQRGNTGLALGGANATTLAGYVPGGGSK